MLVDAKRLFPLFMVLLMAAPARAQPAEIAGEASSAEALFLEGRAALAEGDLELACRRFAESVRLVRRPSSLLNLATCEKDLGRVASALRHAEEALEILPPSDPRLPIAKQIVDETAVRAPKLSLSIAPSLPSTTVVLFDGEPLEWRGHENLTILVDPGVHVLVVRAAGYQSSEQQLHVEERSVVTALIDIGPRDESKADVDRAEPVSRTSTIVEVDPHKRDASYNAPRAIPIAGWTLLGLGSAAVTVAAISGGIVLANDREIAEVCPAKECSPEGLATVEQTQTLAVVNTAAWVAAGVSLAASAVLLGVGYSLKLPGSKSVSVTVRPLALTMGVSF